jgi:HK97 family phage prohead protease
MKMLNKHILLPMIGFKAIGKDMEFTCHTNVKGNIDHAQDRTVDGAYLNSIKSHKANNTMPKMFWNHDRTSPPVGIWLDMEEDEKGLFKRGRMLDTDRGVEVYKGLISKAIDSFSIGYAVVQEKYNSSLGCNDLIELDIKESSPVNFACNEQARLVDIKNRLGDGEVLSKADLRILLEDSKAGLSKRQIERVTADYNPKDDIENNELKYLLESSAIFQ